MMQLEELMAVALGHRDGLSRAWTREEWEAVFAEAKKQTVTGLCASALDKLEGAQKAPLGIYTRWMLLTEKIEKKTALIRSRLVEVVDMFEQAGYRCCLLKGIGVASLYPEPKRRQTGDIDIWVDAPRDEVVNFLRSRYELGQVVYHHCDVKMFKDVEVEVHFTPSWMNDFCLNHRLQAYFDSCREREFSHFENGFCVSTVEFNAVYMMVHIFRHVLEEGIGLRQLLDYYFVLQNMEAVSRPQILEVLDSLGLKDFSRAVMYVLQKMFGLEERYMLCTPDAEKGRFLLDEISRSGNFGHADERNAAPEGETILQHSRRKLGRSTRFLKYYPREVLGQPIFMVWQYFWRKKKNYLYNGR